MLSKRTKGGKNEHNGKTYRGGATGALSRFRGNDKIHHYAFTLAEVLITLGIIGIVAAMTIPTLVQNQRNKALQVKLKKSYSVLQQALNMYQAENGIRLIPQNCGVRTVKPILLQYIKNAKDCGWGYLDMNTTACAPNHKHMDAENKDDYIYYKTFNGNTSANIDLFDDGQFVLPDGSFVMIENPGESNVYVSIDLNGLGQGPNRLGQDLFMFHIIDDGTLLPMGAEKTKYYSKNDVYCSNTSNDEANGAGCTYKALNDPDFFNNLPE